jgi:putative Mg2+ transporter-C (MgtC) family protein
LAGQVVVGVGFMGGGVFLKEGINVRGLNTAATIWCSGAIGALAGAGLVLGAVAGTVGVLALNIALQPVSNWLLRHRSDSIAFPSTYRLRASCRASQEALIQGLLIHFINNHPTMAIQRLTIEDGQGAEQASLVADIYAERRDDQLMVDLTAFARNQAPIASVSWERNLPPYESKPDAISTE